MGDPRMPLHSTVARGLAAARTGFAALIRLSAPGLRQLEALQNSPLIHRHRLLVALLAVGVVGVWIATADDRPAAPEIQSRAIAPPPRAGWEEPPILGFYQPDEHRARQAAPVPERAPRRRVVSQFAAEPPLPRITGRSVSLPSGAAVRRDAAVPRVRHVARKGVEPGHLSEPPMRAVVISPAVSLPGSVFASLQPTESDAAPADEDLRDGEMQIAGLAPRALREIDPGLGEASDAEDPEVVEPPVGEDDPMISPRVRSPVAGPPWLRKWQSISSDRPEAGDEEPAPVEPSRAWKSPRLPTHRPQFDRSC